MSTLVRRLTALAQHSCLCRLPSLPPLDLAPSHTQCSLRETRGPINSFSRGPCLNSSQTGAGHFSPGWPSALLPIRSIFELPILELNSKEMSKILFTVHFGPSSPRAFLWFKSSPYSVPILSSSIHTRINKMRRK